MTKVSKSRRYEIEALFLNRSNWNKPIKVDGVEDNLVYISAKNELRRIHYQNGDTVAILIGFYIGSTLMMTKGEWE